MTTATPCSRDACSRHTRSNTNTFALQSLQPACRRSPSERPFASPARPHISEFSDLELAVSAAAAAGGGGALREGVDGGGRTAGGTHARVHGRFLRVFTHTQRKSTQHNNANAATRTVRECRRRRAPPCPHHEKAEGKEEGRRRCLRARSLLAWLLAWLFACLIDRSLACGRTACSIGSRTPSPPAPELRDIAATIACSVHRKPRHAR